MKVYLQDDVIFYDYQTGTKTTYWLDVGTFEHAESQIEMLWDIFMKKWFTASVIEQTIHCLMEARPNKDWSVLKAKMLNEINNYPL